MATCKPSEQYLNKLRERYHHATKKQRGKILDEFVETTGYHRKHAIALLRGLRRHRDPKLPLRIRAVGFTPTKTNAPSCGSPSSSIKLAPSACAWRWIPN